MGAKSDRINLVYPRKVIFRLVCIRFFLILKLTKLNPMKKHYFRRWLLLAPTGLALIGFGLSLLGEATLAKFAGQSWFWPGTLALIVTNSGVVLFGESIKARWAYEQSNPDQKNP